MTVNQTALGVPLRRASRYRRLLQQLGIQRLTLAFRVIPCASVTLNVYRGCAGSTAEVKVSRIVVYFKSAVLKLKHIGQPRHYCSNIERKTNR